jgi:hypothetical protein
MPITIQQQCLTHAQPGIDTSHILKLFKIACLSYKPSDVVYRDHTMTRAGLIAIRRELIEKVSKTLPHSKLFKDGVIYPRRYFDDLVVEQRNK